MIIPDLVRMHTLPAVQQPCSNPSKSPENLGKVFSKENRYLQEFCKLQNAPANYHTAFTRQRSLVRSQHRPLTKTAVLQVKRRLTNASVRLPTESSVQQRSETSATFILHLLRPWATLRPLVPPEAQDASI